MIKFVWALALIPIASLALPTTAAFSAGKTSTCLTNDATGKEPCIILPRNGDGNFMVMVPEGTYTFSKIGPDEVTVTFASDFATAMPEIYVRSKEDRSCWIPKVPDIKAGSTKICAWAP